MNINVFRRLGQAHTGICLVPILQEAKKRQLSICERSKERDDILKCDA